MKKLTKLLAKHKVAIGGAAVGGAAWIHHKNTGYWFPSVGTGSGGTGQAYSPTQSPFAPTYVPGGGAPVEMPTYVPGGGSGPATIPPWLWKWIRSMFPPPGHKRHPHKPGKHHPHKHHKHPKPGKHHRHRSHSHTRHPNGGREHSNRNSGGVAPGRPRHHSVPHPKGGGHPKPEHQHHRHKAVGEGPTNQRPVASHQPGRRPEAGPNHRPSAPPPRTHRTKRGK